MGTAKPMSLSIVTKIENNTPVKAKDKMIFFTFVFNRFLRIKINENVAKINIIQ